MLEAGSTVTIHGKIKRQRTKMPLRKTQQKKTYTVIPAMNEKVATGMG